MSMITAPNPTSALTWDMIALSVFIVIAVINVIAIARKSKSLKFWMALGLVSAFALQLVEGLLFALMETRVWWHSVIMPVDFIVVALVCGLAIAVIVCALQKDEYNPEALHDLSFLLVVAIIIHLVLAVIELALVCLGGSAADAGALTAIGGTWLLYVLELGLPLVAVFVLLRGKKDPAKSMLIGNFIKNQFMVARDWPLGAAASTILTLLLALLIVVYRMANRKAASRDRMDEVA